MTDDNWDKLMADIATNAGVVEGVCEGILKGKYGCSFHAASALVLIREAKTSGVATLFKWEVVLVSVGGKKEAFA